MLNNRKIFGLFIMNSNWFWHCKFNNKQVRNYIPFNEVEEKFKTKIFVFSDIGDLDIEKYINEPYDFYVLMQTESNSTANVLRIIEKYKDRVIVLGNVLLSNTPLSLDNENFFYSGDWLQSPLYREHPLHNLKLCRREYDFDFLLGRQDEFRDYLYNCFEGKGILDRSLYSYCRNNNIHRFDVETNRLISKKNISSVRTIQNIYSDEKIDLSAFCSDNLASLLPMAISRITPKEIYKHSFASIVRETCFGDFTKNIFVTEKTAKPIWAKRLFFPIANQNFCKALEEIGFNLYHDYSYYDSEPDYITRVDKFTEYILSLNSENLIKMYKNNLTNIDYNYRFVSKKNWTQEGFNFVMNRLSSL